MLAQILAILFILFALSRVFLRFKQQQLRLRSILLWSLLWLAAVVFLFKPKAFENLTTLFGIGRTVDLVIYASLLLLFYMIFRTYVQMETLETELTELTRKLALKDLKKIDRP